MGNITLNIDGQIVEAKAGTSILKAALDAGIYIPHLCYHEDLKSIGSCGLCVVELQDTSEIIKACQTIVKQGMTVKTNASEVEYKRRLSMELMLARHPSECTECPKYLKCELQSLAQYLGVSAERLRKSTSNIPLNSSNPLIVHDFTRCVLCGRCVRVCNEVRGVGVLHFIKKDGETRIGTVLGLSLADSGCRFCGSCVEVCPTGAIRDQVDIFQPKLRSNTSLPPCQSACPAEVDIPRYLRYIHSKNCSAAEAVIREKVPFPMILGYICNHRCETNCRRNALNEPISVCRLKRYALENGDGQWKAKVRMESPTGKRAGVVGAGPAGLTAAYYLAKLGHKVEVLEALPLPGGMCSVGIPEYRLPRDLIKAEIKEIENAGVIIKTNTKVNSLNTIMSEGRYDAVLIAIGAHQGIKLPVPGVDLEGVYVATSFLKEVNLGNEVKVGKKVVVIGGGNVAFDCARVACRLGADEVHVVCPESRDKMPASHEDIEQGEEEGIIIHPSRLLVKIKGKQDNIAGVETLEVGSIEVDEERRLKIKTINNSEEVLNANTVIFAVRQIPENIENFDLELGRGNTLYVDPDTLATSREGIFAAGDAVTGTDSVIAAIASGRKAAREIDKYLGGTGIIDDVLAPIEKAPDWIGHIDDFAYLKRRIPSIMSVDERISCFKIVEESYREEDALYESQRCLQCDLRMNITKPKFWGDFSTHK